MFRQRKKVNDVELSLHFEHTNIHLFHIHTLVHPYTDTFRPRFIRTVRISTVTVIVSGWIFL